VPDPTIASGLLALAAGLAGGGMGTYAVSRATRRGLLAAVDRSEQASLDGGRAARETLMRSSTMELLRAAGRVPMEMQALGIRVTRDDRRRGFAFLDALRALGAGPAYLTPPVLQERWATLVELVQDFAHAWPVLDPLEYGGDSVESQLTAGGWMPEVYAAARGTVQDYAAFVVESAVAVIADEPLPADRPRPVLAPELSVSA
jgi:hypothetical protein